EHPPQPGHARESSNHRPFSLTEPTEHKPLTRGRRLNHYASDGNGRMALVVDAGKTHHGTLLQVGERPGFGGAAMQPDGDLGRRGQIRHGDAAIRQLNLELLRKWVHTLNDGGGGGKSQRGVDNSLGFKEQRSVGARLPNGKYPVARGELVDGHVRVVAALNDGSRADGEGKWSMGSANRQFEIGFLRRSLDREDSG